MGHEPRLQASMVNCADDFVSCCRHKADEAMAAMRTMMDKLKRTVNEEKTTSCHMPEDRGEFLGYPIGR
jgi:RNA-directed DNA polymerase